MGYDFAGAVSSIVSRVFSVPFSPDELPDYHNDSGYALTAASSSWRTETRVVATEIYSPQYVSNSDTSYEQAMANLERFAETPLVRNETVYRKSRRFDDVQYVYQPTTANIPGSVANDSLVGVATSYRLNR